MPARKYAKNDQGAKNAKYHNPMPNKPDIISDQKGTFTKKGSMKG